MKNKITLIIVMFAALMGTVKDAKCNVGMTLIFPQSLLAGTSPIRQVGFCSSPVPVCTNIIYSHIDGGGLFPNDPYFVQYYKNKNTIIIQPNGQQSTLYKVNNQIYVSFCIDGKNNLIWQGPYVNGQTVTVTPYMGQQGAIAVLNTQISSLQSQIAALTVPLYPGQRPNPEIAILQSQVAGLQTKLKALQALNYSQP